jgi:hypothetical protein
LVAYLLYNAVTYALPFLFVLRIKGFHAKFSLLGFVPHSLYVFMLWRLPAVMFAEPLTDKFVVSLSMLLIVTGRFPYSILSLCAAAAGYWAWSCDLLKIRKLITVPNPEISMVEPSLEAERGSGTNGGALQMLLDMGVSIENARGALEANGGDPERAAHAIFG